MIVRRCMAWSGGERAEGVRRHRGAQSALPPFVVSESLTTGQASARQTPDRRGANVWVYR